MYFSLLVRCLAYKIFIDLFQENLPGDASVDYVNKLFEQFGLVELSTFFVALCLSVRNCELCCNSVVACERLTLASRTLLASRGAMLAPHVMFDCLLFRST